MLGVKVEDAGEYVHSKVSLSKVLAGEATYGVTLAERMRICVRNRSHQDCMKIKRMITRRKDNMKSKGMAARGQITGISRLKNLWSWAK